MSLKKPLDMRDQTHLFKRDGTYYFRARIPADLLPHFSPKREIVTSLRTKDKTEAKRLVSAMALRVQQEWETIRRLAAAGPRTSITEGEIQQLVALMVESRLSLDEDGRLQGLSDEAYQETDAILGDLEGRDRAAIARGDFSDRGETMGLSSIALPAGDWLQAHGFALPSDSPDLRRFLMEFAKGSRRASEMIRQRQQGEPIDTPKAAPWAPVEAPSGVPVVAKGKHKLSEALVPWQAFKKPSTGSVEIYTAGVGVFEERFPDLHAETITKADVKAFVSKRMEEGKSPKTIEKEHGVIRALLTFAVEEGWREDNPAARVMLPKDTGGRKRRGYKPEELAALFKTGVFTKGDRPIAGKGAAAFWLPLLAVFTGARREELAQLATDRVRVEMGVPYLALDPLDDSGNLKTDESRRAVPLHRELIRLGFLEFVEDCRRAGGGHLFPLLKPNKRGQYAAKFGDWWGRYVRDKAGVADPMIAPMHSFRHAVITDLRQQRIREDEERQLLGHADRNGRSAQVDSHDGYGEHLVPTLAEVVNLISHRGLDLSGVQPYVSRFNKPGGCAAACGEP